MKVVPVVAVLAGLVFAGGCAADRVTVHQPRYDLYDHLPSCDGFSAEVSSELGKFVVTGEFPTGGAEAGVRCLSTLPDDYSLHVQVDLHPKRDDDSAVKRVSLEIKSEGGAGGELKGNWDIASYHLGRCFFHARDSNLVARIQLLSPTLTGPCDKKRLLRYAKDWAAQNFTR